MKSFRLARRRLPGAAPGRPAVGPGLRWLGFLAAACLAAVLAGWPTMLAGSPTMLAADGPGVVLTAAQRPQARVINPGPPTGLIATAGNGQVTLSWNAPAPGGSPPARYNVYEGTSAGFLGTPIGSTTGTSGTMTGLANGTTYYFVVTVVAANGTMRAASAEVSAEPTGKAVLTSKEVPQRVIVSVSAMAIGATAGALILAALRLRTRPPRSHPPAAPPSEVRAVPDPGGPSPVSLHGIGVEETCTVRLESLPAAIITTIEEISS